jgi:hypothetical protein
VIIAVVRSFLTVTLALWLGSLAHLLLSVISLFRSFPRAESELAPTAANHLFNASETYHLTLALIAVASAGVLRLIDRVGRYRLIPVLLVVALMLAAGTSMFVTTPMNALRAAGEGGGAEFQRLHRVANILYLAQTACVLGAVVALGVGNAPKKPA